MTTTPDDIQAAITNARHHLDGCEARGAEAARVQAEADRLLQSFPPVEAGRMAKTQLAVLQAEAAVEAATARYAECVRIVGAAHTQWSTLLRAAFVGRELDAMRAVLVQARALTADLGARLADRQATAQLLGCADSGGHPHANAVAFVEALERYLHQLDPPPPAPAPPPPAGQVRVRALVHFSDAVERWRHEPNTVFCLPEAEATQVIEKKWAVPAEA